jgi:hypothetical protein
MQSNTITKQFIDAFDTKNKAHVRWLKKFFDFAENLATARKPIDEFINTNPMGITVNQSEILEWIHIHFSLAMKYSKDVLNGKAWIPEQ